MVSQGVPWCTTVVHGGTLWYMVYQVKFTVEEGLWERIRQVAREQDRSVAWVARRAVEECLGRPGEDSPVLRGGEERKESGESGERLVPFRPAAVGPAGGSEHDFVQDPSVGARRCLVCGGRHR